MTLSPYHQIEICTRPVHLANQSLGLRGRLYCPPGNHDRLLIAVHGVTRGWKELGEALCPHAVQAQVPLLVPEFSRADYSGYQRLAPGASGVPADLALLELIELAAREVGVEGFRSTFLFGFSGGAQFAHRFTLAHPRVVERQVLVAAGFYTMPNTELEYPYGLASGESGRGDFGVEGFFRPTLVAVGRQDTQRDRELRKSKALDTAQGRQRLERARRYVLAVRACNGRAGRVPVCRLLELEGCSHDFAACVGAGLLEESFSFLQAAPHASEGGGAVA